MLANTIAEIMIQDECTMIAKHPEVSAESD